MLLALASRAPSLAGGGHRNPDPIRFFENLKAMQLGGQRTPASSTARAYQLAFRTPGKRPSWAISRNTWRDNPKSRKKALGRPVKKHRLCIRVALLSLGNACNCLWIVNFSSKRSVSLICCFKINRCSLYLAVKYCRLFWRSIMLFFAIIFNLL